jgi:hypothetical protein
MPNNTVPAATTGLPNRRLFLAAGPAAAVFCAVSAAAETDADLEVLIAAHRQASEAHALDADPLGEAEDRFMAMTARIDWSPIDPGHGFFLDVRNIAAGRASFIKSMEMRKSSLVDAVSGLGPTPLLKAWKLFLEERLAAFDRLAAEVNAAKQSSGLAAAYEIFDKSGEAMDAAFERIVSYRPATLPAMRRWASYLIENDDFCVVSVDTILRSLAGSES